MEPVDIHAYTYDLPQEKIALFPLPERDLSKLLVFRRGKITHEIFRNIAVLLPENAFLVFNDTKVIPARLHFRKETGAEIEVLVLHPVEPSTVTSVVMSERHACTWECTIGNLKRWPGNQTLSESRGDIILTATLTDRLAGRVRFTWTSGRPFAEIISTFGETPLPPYLKRAPADSDRTSYQTVYARREGAVAAPTAGLHFTERVFRDLANRRIGHDFLTLHVGAGTFLPIKVSDVTKHRMHEEQIVITKKNITNLLDHLDGIVAVGTTSMRAVESIYWFGAKLMGGDARFMINQDDPYLSIHAPEAAEALKAVIAHMEETGSDTLVGETSIFIRPGYTFRICRGLVTNFHQPESTLILLVAAFIGDNWKRVYSEALASSYRFLSYGDSSLLLP